MKTIEQKRQEETFKRFVKIREKYTVSEIAKAYGATASNINYRVVELKAGKARPTTTKKFNNAFDKLNEVNDGKY